MIFSLNKERRRDTQKMASTICEKIQHPQIMAHPTSGQRQEQQYQSNDQKNEADVTKQKHTYHHRTSDRKRQKSQFSSMLLFASVIVLVNLCPFEQDLHTNSSKGINNNKDIIPHQVDLLLSSSQMSMENCHLNTAKKQQQCTNETTNLMYISHQIEKFLKIVKLMFSNPIKMNQRVVRYTMAEARVLGKMAKVWYIKKKIKKLSKKLKKHTIAVPVFTAIPIYEHSY